MTHVLGRVFLAHIFFIVLSYLGEGNQLVRADGEVLAATSTTTTKKIKNIAVGEVIQIGSSKFVKIGTNQYIAVEPESCLDPVLTSTNAVKNFTYTGSYQTFTAYVGCQYKVELWGARGGNGYSTYLQTGRTYGGNGGYVSGILRVTTNSTLYLYLGYAGTDTVTSQAVSDYWTNGGYNGGGRSVSRNNSNVYVHNSGSGGGATDIRTTSGNWNNANSLRSRIAVAAGGGGGSGHEGKSVGGAAGGVSGGTGNNYNTSNWTVVYGGTQVSGGSYSGNGGGNIGSFGTGADGYYSNCASAGGGGGWYGGTSGQWGSGAGGSSYISGHTGCVAVTSLSNSTPKSGCTTGTTNNSCSLSPTGLSFTDTLMIDGAGYKWTNVKGSLQPMPNPSGGYYASGVGHTGNGAARITRLN